MKRNRHTKQPRHTKRPRHSKQLRFRVWIVQYDHWQPSSHHDIPVEAIVLEPAEYGSMPRGEAALYVESFNRTALEGGRKIWAVAIPVVLRYEGDPQPGETIGNGKQCAQKKPAMCLSGIDT